MGITVQRLFYGDGVRDQLSDLRLLAWKTRTPELSSYNGDMMDEHDKTAVHFAAYDRSRLIAAARVNIASQESEVPDHQTFMPVLTRLKRWPVAIFSRLVVDPDYGGRSIPLMLRKPREAFAREVGCSAILLWSRTTKAPHRSFDQEGYSIAASAPQHRISALNEMCKRGEIAIMKKTLV